MTIPTPQNGQDHHKQQILDAISHMNYRTATRFIAGQFHGIISTRQAAEWDIPADVLRTLCNRGALRRLAHGVYRHLEVPRTRLTAYAAAVECVGPDAWIARRSVLPLVGLDTPSRVISVGVPRRIQRKLPAFIDVIEEAVGHIDTIGEFKGIRTFRPEVVLVENEMCSITASQIAVGIRIGVIDATVLSKVPHRFRPLRQPPEVG
ncbi:hypothetical protein [Corynebacterium cystitidis]|uniref:Transcriptional regulator, AbiEi antitoxin, Type IV TA system n=1 Tax=Corynebacterium cystitidis DSM 20524 TaxID=1121357 RepID=A0A1H9V7R0_9CORY|nr:hypothetical protein [Corynebacterium cystitidis]WJY83302.1 hypothetical protein CCYS_12065 [Corynebacterium cystitidis DSM 20524]SES17599.1 Transcriptional regulator, AbiEi antitoxin, Type IV TA system [Corynebacterium cystitidis DSM 20524]SNV63632.1 Uncharacterised protein [Corynebacterium cystitidis]